MRRLVRWLPAAALVLALLWLSFPYILNALAARLIVSDRLAPADVILVLSGDTNGERVVQGVKLYKEGYARKIMMSGGTLTWNLSYAEWMKKQALASGVPGSAILLQDRSRSTIDDAKFSLPLIESLHFKTVIVVTSPYHSRRAAAVFKKIYGCRGIRVIVCPAERSDFNPHDWWRRHEDTQYVVWEYVARVLYLLKGY